MDTLLSLSILISCVLSRHLLNTGTQFEADWANGGTIPSARTEAIVFNFDTKIFILGGWDNPRALIECDISSSLSSCTPATTPFNHDIRTYSQSYTQIGNLGYLLGDYVTAQTSLYVYTLSNNAPTLSKTITIPKNRAGNTACLTNTNDKLFVIGGQDKANLGTKYYRSKTLQIYNLPNGPWETNPYPHDMNQERDACACVVVGDYVYAIGGYSKLYAVNYNKDIDTIERIQITNILNNKWQYTPYNLLQGINSLRAIVIDEKYIITISGLRTNIAVVSTTQAIQIINTIDNTIKYANGAFNTRSYGNAVIHINNIIYAFGGWNGNVNPTLPINTWQYITLLSDSPTISPTISPTQYTYSPSISPTYKPTNSPTVSPSKHPTNKPTVDPTMTPSEHPTNSPSKHPTTIPTYNPTNTPSEHPTIIPTYNPTDEPSHFPSTNPTVSTTAYPTVNPTMNPTINSQSPTQSPSNMPTLGPTISSSTDASVSLIIIVSVVFGIITFVLIGYCFIKRKTNVLSNPQYLEMKSVQHEGTIVNSISRDYNQNFTPGEELKTDFI